MNLLVDFHDPFRSEESQGGRTAPGERRKQGTFSSPTPSAHRLTVSVSDLDAKKSVFQVDISIFS